MELQQAGTQGRGGGAATALFHVIQPVQHKAGLHPGNHLLQHRQDLRHRLPGLRGLCGGQHQHPMAHRQVGGVHHIHAVHLLRRQAGVLVAAGKAHADVQVDDRVILLHQTAEQLLIVRHIDGVGGGDLAAGVHMGGDVPGADVHPVLVQLPRLDDPQRGHGDIVSLQQLPRQVAGGVGGDLNHTDSSFWSHPRTAVRG